MRTPRPALHAILLLLLTLPLLASFAAPRAAGAAAGFREPGLLPGIGPDETVVTVADLARLRSQPAPPAINAHAAILWDAGSGVELYAKAPDDRLVPASTTKMLSALLVVAHARPDQRVTIQPRDFGPADESRMCGLSYTVCLEAGDVVTIEDLLYGMLLASGGDAARAAARTVGTALLAGAPGDPVDRFVQEMNGWVARRGLANTHFVNPDGYEADDHYSSARDLLRIADALLQDPLLARIVATTETTRRTADGSKAIPLKNSNQLLGQRAGIHGVKTGTAGDELQWECLVVTQSAPGGRILSVVLGSTSRYSDTTALLDWANAAYRWVPAELPGLGPALARWGIGFREAEVIVLPAWEAPMLRYRLLLDPGAAAPGGARGEVVFLAGPREVLRLPVYATDGAATPATPAPATPARR